MASRDIYERTFDEDVQQTDDNGRPECDGSVTTTSHETACDGCGLVLDADPIDHGPEWRGNDGERSRIRRAGSPNTVARYDRGIGSNIVRKRDGYGRQLDGTTQKHLSRLRRRHRRTKIGSKAERNQVAGLTEIRRLAGALGGAVSALLASPHNASILEEGGVEFGIHKDTRSPVVIDPFAREDGYAKFTVGDPGSGKSFGSKQNFIWTIQQDPDRIGVILERRSNDYKKSRFYVGTGPSVNV